MTPRKLKLDAEVQALAAKLAAAKAAAAAEEKAAQDQRDKALGRAVQRVMAGQGGVTITDLSAWLSANLDAKDRKVWGLS